MSVKKPIKFLLVLCLLLLLAETSGAAVLKKIRYRSYKDKLRIVFDLDARVNYRVSSGEGFLGITLPKTSAGGPVKNVTELNNEIVNYIGCEKLDEDLKIGVFFRFNSPYKMFFLPQPPRLVIDCSRDFMAKTRIKPIAPGVDYFEMVQGLPYGHTRVHILKIDQKKAMVKPALAFPKTEAESIWESMAQFFSTLLEEEQEQDIPPFSRNRVSEIAKRNRAIAAINATYFASNGRPLGMLMIDKELITLPPYERTALALTADKKAFIDTFLTATYFSLKDKSIYEITKINEPRGSSDCILYTPRYGSRTRTNPGGFEITSRKGEITKIALKNSPIPPDGFVLSAKGAALENLAEKARVGDPLNLHLTLIPFSFQTKVDILHLVGGGPRLVRKGKVYVSKYMERFKRDIARGRAARSAVGITKDNKLLLVAVDGKLRGAAKRKLLLGEEESVGMTLEELSNLMLYLGATEAMNLDGGGSSTMVIKDKVVNRPVNGKEKKVSTAIIILPR